jgi:biopolymer transport protein TolR
MGMSLGGGRSGGKRHRSNSEINVTPMVDVMLVLLVIFMITAPTLKEGLSVDIPRATATQSINIEEAHLITVTEQGYVLKNKASTLEERYRQIPDLVADLKAYLKTCESARRTPTVVIVGDRQARYDRIVQVWNAVINAGVEQVSFQVEPGEPERTL